MINSYFKQNPLTSILILAFLIRLIAVIFSQGYMMFDDQFLVVEIPHAWTHNYDYDSWLSPASKGEEFIPAGFSLIYPGFQYFFFVVSDFLGIKDPQIIMFFNRLIHALLSLVTINYAYKIAEKLGNRKVAIQVGILLSVLAIFPNMSVRNLVEMVGIPFIMWGTYLQVKALESKNKTQLIFWGAFIIGFSFSIRFQNALFLAGIGLYYLFKMEWKNATVFALGGFLSMFLFQIQDYLLFGEWFTEFKGYVEYNNAHKNDFLQGGLFKYIVVIIVATGIPLSIAMMFGFFRYPKKYLLLFLPGFIFLAFHSIFPNKQERFILPVVPLILTNGLLAWNYFESKSKFWKEKIKLKKGLITFFWVTNTILLVLMTTHSTKQARVQAAEYIYNQNEKVDFILVEETDRSFATRIPMFYMGQYAKYVNLIKSDESIYSDYKKTIQAQKQRAFEIEPKGFNTGDPILAGSPDYAFIVGDEKLQQRLADLKQSLPNLKWVYSSEPSFMDKVFQKNKRNNNRPIHIYKNH